MPIPVLDKIDYAHHSLSLSLITTENWKEYENQPPENSKK